MTDLPNTIKTDAEGYLQDPQQWDESIAAIIAKLEDIELSDDHWEVIRYVRQFYQEFNTSPSIRPLVKYLAKVLPPEKSGSLYLQILFPEGPAKQATKIAGLPKPARCT
ncbi:TusE/DsrC/DsvC family sulfur relay protein [Aliikangiella coralliicola]|uniref:Sulfurtransferase n=1 Tax=Aliikangiella coralliicola TaxID=2592383 RepID=A0A545UAK8_9GAMM|nr:TusE/DsrC/DsvC family sulfur relay protein [Aliikangiella coralliicola]TQV86501.1 TusE/DsrC/DsvC family sulfur relay protein [Aliikangiella coralliicola]